MNKKGSEAVRMGVYAVPSILIIALVFFFGWVYLNLHEKVDEEVIHMAKIQDSNLLLRNYLRTNVKVDDKDLTMGELISLWYYDRNKYDRILEESSKEILDSFPKVHEVSGWNVRIFPPNKDEKDIINFDIVGLYENRNTFASIPLQDDVKETAKVELYLECSDTRCA
jgi:hypothetical protein